MILIEDYLLINFFDIEMLQRRPFSITHQCSTRNEYRLRNYPSLTKFELLAVQKYKDKREESEKENMLNSFFQKPSNSIGFYRITPHQQLPVPLQKHKFHSTNIKEKQLVRDIPLERSPCYTPQQSKARKTLKRKGQIMFLSEIYNHLNENTDPVIGLAIPHCNLDKWEKSAKMSNTMPTKLASATIEGPDFKSSNGKLFKKQGILRMKQEASFINEVERNLQIISMSHSSEMNFLNKFSLIQNSSKLLKHQLDRKRLTLEKEIDGKLRNLEVSRKKHHQLYTSKGNLYKQQKETIEKLNKQQTVSISKVNKSFTVLSKNDKIQEIKAQTEVQEQKIDSQILDIKAKIEIFQSEVQKLEQQLKDLAAAEDRYYFISLKNGMDCREVGLGWIIKELKEKNSEIDLQFPVYLDPKSVNFIRRKTDNELNLENLLKEKQIFVNQIGKKDKVIETSDARSLKCLANMSEVFSVPAKYRKSKRKITLLDQEYCKNQSLLELPDKKQIEISTAIESKNARQIYALTQERIKRINPMRVKKEKTAAYTSKIIRYQNLLQKIKEAHVSIEDQEMKQEQHLLQSCRHERQLFLLRATASFGCKKAYYLIIKHFSLNSLSQGHQQTDHQ